MKDLLLILFLLMVIIIQGQQSKGIIDSKSSKELKPFKFELEYTPMSDIQPLFLIKTKKDNYLGIKILSTSFFTIFNDRTTELFQINPITGFQTTIFVGLNSNSYLTLNHIGDNDLINIFYRKYFNRNRYFIDVGYFYNYSIIKKAPDFIHFFGTELSYQFKIKERISIGGNLKFGPIIHNNFDVGLVYGGLGISISYLVINFKLY